MSWTTKRIVLIQLHPNLEEELAANVDADGVAVLETDAVIDASYGDLEYLLTQHELLVVLLSKSTSFLFSTISYDQ